MIMIRALGSLPVMLGLALGGLGPGVSAPGAAAAAATGEALLEPHVAAYRLSLQQRSEPGPFVDAQGGLVIEWRLACDGWLSRQRLGFAAATAEGHSLEHDIRYSSWEADDGSRLRYTIRSFEGPEIAEEYLGEAWVTTDQGGTAAFRRPKDERVDLPPDTVFPTDHLRQVLAQAQLGARFVSHKVFDGWGFDALTQITTVIGDPQPLARWVSDGAGGSGRAWPVSMAYYNVERATELPEFEAHFLLTDQGVLRHLVLDYGDFRLDAELESLELLEHPDC
jgi:hypothetical protein